MQGRGGQGTTQGRGNGALSGGFQRRPGDWDCACGKVVFASKSECFACGAPRPSSAGAARGEGKGCGRGDERKRPLPVARPLTATARAAPSAASFDDNDEVREALTQFFISGETGERLRAHVNAAQDAAKSGSSGSIAPGMRRRRPFLVSGMELFDAVPQAYKMLSDWMRFDELLEDSAYQARCRIAPAVPGRIYLRLANVPGADFVRPSVSQLRVPDTRQFARIIGTVTRAGASKVVQEFRTFRCEQCGHQFQLRASPSSGYEFEVPKQCQSGQKVRGNFDPKMKKSRTTKCMSNVFEPLPSGEDCMNDFQEIRLQDQMNALGPGTVPQSIAVVLFGDLIGRAQPGDTISLEGVVHQRWKGLWAGKRLEVELFIEATNVERISNDSQLHSAQGNAKPTSNDEFERVWAANRADEWQMRAQIVKSTAPWLRGLPVPKLALLLTLIGGSPVAPAGNHGSGGNSELRWNRFVSPDDSSVRQDQSTPVPSPNQPAEAQTPAAPTARGRTTPHLLLLGDPGTGKSQLLQAAQELSSRAVRTSGLGCTSAGLTCAAVRDGPDFVLEAGALVLADGGVCCIDEFSTIRSHDRAAVHEAMEQQTVSVAKAGLVCRLRSQCSVVAAQNCRKGPGSRSGRGSGYNRECSVAVNSGLPPPLLSRFDLVVVFSDSIREEEAAAKPGSADLADFILQSGGQVRHQQQAIEEAKAAHSPGHQGCAGAHNSEWDHDRLRSYVAFARENPVSEAPDPRAVEVITAYFRVLRSQSPDGRGRFTVRFMESLLRLAQAHARLLHHRRVELEDAIAVIVLHRAALQDHVVGADMGDPTHDFPTQMTQMTQTQDGDEISACAVSWRMGSLSLHHGSDIPNNATYNFLEDQMLLRLDLQKSGDGRLCKREPGPMPLMDAPAPDVQGFNGASVAQEPWPNSQAAPNPQRGRRLGCRFR